MSNTSAPLNPFMSAEDARAKTINNYQGMYARQKEIWVSRIKANIATAVDYGKAAVDIYIQIDAQNLTHVPKMLDEIIAMLAEKKYGVSLWMVQKTDAHGKDAVWITGEVRWITAEEARQIVKDTA